MNQIIEQLKKIEHLLLENAEELTDEKIEQEDIDDKVTIETIQGF